MSFRIDSTSIGIRDYIVRYTQTIEQQQVGLQIKTADAYDQLINITADNFTAENATFVNGTIIPGVPNDYHAVFGSEDGERKITTISSYNLLKGTYLSITSVCGESESGSIQLPEDPDNDEDVVIEVSTDNIEFTRLLGRITERNSSTTSYIEYRFPMTEETDNYYIKIKQTEQSDSGYDYYGFKKLIININSSIYDPNNKIIVF